MNNKLTQEQNHQTRAYIEYAAEKPKQCGFYPTDRGIRFWDDSNWLEPQENNFWEPDFQVSTWCHIQQVVDPQNEWLDCDSELTLSNNQRCWVYWNNGEIHLSTFIGDECIFQAPCGTNEGMYDWKGVKLKALKYIPVLTPIPPNDNIRCALEGSEQ